MRPEDPTEGLAPWDDPQPAYAPDDFTSQDWDDEEAYR